MTLENKIKNQIYFMNPFRVKLTIVNNYHCFGYQEKASFQSRKLQGIRFNDSRGRVDFIFVGSEAQVISNVSTTSQELPSSSSTTIISYNNERSNSLRSIVIQ